MVESRRQLGKFEDELRLEKGVSENINFNELRTELIDGVTYLFVECEESDVDTILDQISVEKNEFINLADAEKNGEDSFVKYEIPGITSEINR